MEILEEHQQRLDLALPEEQSLDRIERPLPALGRVERVPCGIVDGDIQQRQQRRQEWLQRAIQRQELAGHSSRGSPAGRRAPRSGKYAFSRSMTGRYGVAFP